MKFGLIGLGEISKKHTQAIEKIGGEIVVTYDPTISHPKWNSLEYFFNNDFDYAVICSPSNFHYEHIKLSLKNNRKVIVEKPQQLPWEPLIDNDNINVVLQLNWLDNLPEKADLVEVKMIRDENYFKSWKGNVRNTGGMLPTLFIHYIDLAIKLDSKFSGMVLPEGKQIRRVDDFDLTKVDMNLLYTKMYHDIVYNDKGIKPKDTMFLNFIMERAGWIFGHSNDILYRKIDFKPNDLIGLVKGN